MRYAFLIVLALTLCIATGLPDFASAQQARPNVVVILADDMRYDDMWVMDKTRVLIGSGTTFSNHYVSFSICCPSRATYLTGQYPHNHGVLGNEPPNGGYTKLDHTNTLATWLQGAGYYTSYIGKHLNGYGQVISREVPPGWTNWQGLIDRTKYQMYNYTINDNGILVNYGEGPENYQTDVLADRAAETIQQASASGQPFYLTVAPTPPHLEELDGVQFSPRAAPRHAGTFSQQPLPRPPSFNEADVSDKPAGIRNKPLLTAFAIQEIKNHYRARLESLLSVDDLVGRVVGALQNAGELGDTLLVFTSDNGWFSGEHRIFRGKGQAYEESTHMPLMIKGQGFPDNTVAAQFVNSIDIAPTIVALTGVPAQRIMDGRSLLPLANNPSLGTARDLLLETNGYKAVRNKQFLYVEHNTAARELYDMRPGTANYDPYQLNSRHASTAYNQIKSQLVLKLSRLRTCVGASCGAQ